MARGQPIAFRKNPESAALDQAGNSHGCAASALDVTASFRGCHLVHIHPHSASTNGNRGCCRLVRWRSLADKSILQNRGVHRSRPDQQGIWRVGGALVTMPAALQYPPNILLT